MSSTLVPRPNPRHPCPELRDEYGPRGWMFFRTNGSCGTSRLHAVFCRSLPAACAHLIGFHEHVAAAWDEIAAGVAEQAEAVEGHAKTCDRCARALDNAKRHAELAG
ncbi:hypothetical protein [Streptomonospora wellingtoniae]|uniref:Zinc-finger domain-containing protein n=1 Tax=Streptomonospora wellingtoniae TaxID=3075544 RepID=A0ABU2KYC1_9ACTN|nr:hypothetical protein [Streptomonospora sp. DSM 45055]MDT0304310.1 hypothetical protein [Streptomonospora sp. DSM 45055]